MKIALIGYGKMGKIIERIATERGHSVVLKIDKDNQNEFTLENLKKVDVAIEFTIPSVALGNYKKCFEANVPVVSGTTGWLENKEIIAAECAKEARFFYASNFSLGVNLFFQLNKYLAKLMHPYQNYVPTMEEIHHIHKLDAPSGTAITIAEGLLENYPSLEKWENSVTNHPNALPIISKREGEVPGTHTVEYTSAEDVISIKHEAKGREGFAFGAVLAAEFLANQSAGWYGMEDLMSL